MSKTIFNKDIIRQLDAIDKTVVEGIVEKNNYDNDLINKELIEYYPVLADPAVMCFYRERERETVMTDIKDNVELTLKETEWAHEVFAFRSVIADIIIILDDLLDNEDMRAFIQSNREVKEKYLDLINVLESDAERFSYWFDVWHHGIHVYESEGCFNDSGHKDAIMNNLADTYAMYVDGVTPCMKMLPKMHDKIMVPDGVNDDDQV